jgi:excisionase family DNA binding protein
MELLTVSEAAKVLRVSPLTLRAWSRGPRPRVPVIRLGRRVLFDRLALEDWIKQRTLHPREERDET